MLLQEQLEKLSLVSTQSYSVSWHNERSGLFLTPAQVEAYHARGLELYGGSEGLRHRSLFEGAVAQAQNIYWYANGDLYDRYSSS